MEFVDADGCTALHVSARDGHLEVLTFLAEQGSAANIAAADNDGETVWDLLAERLADADEDNVDVGNVAEVRELAVLRACLRVLVLRGVPPPNLVLPTYRLNFVAWCTRGHGCEQGFRRISCCGGTFSRRAVLCCYPHFRHWYTATWSSPPLRSSGLRSSAQRRTAT
jgi:hypothetical protein